MLCDHLRRTVAANRLEQVVKVSQGDARNFAGADTFTVRKPDPGHILQLIDKMGGRRDRTNFVIGFT